jgi:hypothetical protein
MRRTTVKTTMTKADVFGCRDGNCLGEAEVDWDRYESESRESKGAIMAGLILDRATIARMRITGQSAIWLARRPDPVESGADNHCFSFDDLFDDLA